MATALPSPARTSYLGLSICISAPLTLSHLNHLPQFAASQPCSTSACIDCMSANISNLRELPLRPHDSMPCQIPRTWLHGPHLWYPWHTCRYNVDYAGLGCSDVLYALLFLIASVRVTTMPRAHHTKMPLGPGEGT